MTEPKPRGRPRVAERMEPVATRLPLADYDRLVHIARLQQVTLAQLVRQILIVQTTTFRND